MHPYLIQHLQCPNCYNELSWHIREQNDNRIETAEAHCAACSATYPVRDSIGLFLTPDLPRNDLWQQVDSGLIKHLRQHPDLQRQLLDPPLDTLSPADQFFRVLLLEANGRYIEAQKASELALTGLYTPVYNKCWASQTDFLIQQLATTEGPIVDLASGRGYLVEKMVRQLNHPIVATDFSPAVLRRNREWLIQFGLYDRVSLLAFDARRTPFKNGAVNTLTTNLGLPNIEQPAILLKELQRIVNGQFLAISYFFPQDDQPNAQIIQEAGLEIMLYKPSALTHFADAGWDIALKNSCRGEAQPTPASLILEGARIDGLPAAETMLEWGVLIATNDNN